MANCTCYRKKIKINEPLVQKSKKMSIYYVFALKPAGFRNCSQGAMLWLLQTFPPGQIHAQ